MSFFSFGEKMRKKQIQKLNICKYIIINNCFCEKYIKDGKKKQLTLEQQAIAKLKPF